MDEPFAALDEITRFKLNDDLLALWRALGKTVVFVTHSVFESVYLSQRVVVMTRAARPRFAAACDRRARSATRRFRTSAEYAGYCRMASEALGRAMACGSGGMSEAPRIRPIARDSVLRVLLPLVVLALGVLAWDLVVRHRATSALRPARARPGACDARSPTGRCCASSLCVTLTTTFEGLRAGSGRRRRARHAVQSVSRLIEHSLYPYAVILQVTPVVAIAPLLLIYLPQQAAVLACAWIVAFFPVLANTTLGLNSVDHNLVDLFRLYGASRCAGAVVSEAAGGAAAHAGGLQIAGGLSLIGAVVAEIAAGSAGAGSGLAYRIAESGYRLNIPRMFAALLLLSVAGIVIFFAAVIALASRAAPLARKRDHAGRLVGGQVASAESIPRVAPR